VSNLVVQSIAKLFPTLYVLCLFFVAFTLKTYSLFATHCEELQADGDVTRIPSIVSHKSESNPHISANILVYLLIGQYYRNETWIY